MFLKVLFQFKYIVFFAFTGFLFSACANQDLSKRKTDSHNRPPELQNRFTVPGQILPPESIQSIVFHKTGNPRSAPIIKLKSGETLTLEFDYMREEADQLTVQISHKNADWSESGLMANNFLTSMNKDFISVGDQSRVQDPSYSHFSYRFPNRNFGMKVSGNYMLEVYLNDSDQLLFSLPFFVHEDTGQLETRVQTLFNLQAREFRKAHQLFSKFRYPDFIRIPRVDLSYYYVQNEFWGRAKKVQIFDDVTPGVINFHLARERSFNATYTFFDLNLENFNVDGQRIREINQETIPPQIQLYRDVINLSDQPVFTSRSRFGQPNIDRFSRYANVQFYLDTPSSFNTNQDIFLVGDFNNWGIKEAQRMRYDPEKGLWEGNAFAKQGRYTYKYVSINRNNYSVDDILLDDTFANVFQNYTVFVYFKDPEKFFTRLLTFQRLRAN